MEKVLVVEDEATVRLTLRKRFEARGLTVLECETAEAALDLCASGRPDLLLLDFNLADGRTGWSVAPAVRADPARYGKPLIVAMSGTVDFNEPQMEDCSRADFDLFVQKPIDFSSFWTRLETLARA